jgi:hypothetical protein
MRLAVHDWRNIAIALKAVSAGAVNVKLRPDFKDYAAAVASGVLTSGEIAAGVRRAIPQPTVIEGPQTQRPEGRPASPILNSKGRTLRCHATNAV